MIITDFITRSHAQKCNVDEDLGNVEHFVQREECLVCFNGIVLGVKKPLLEHFLDSVERPEE